MFLCVCLSKTVDNSKHGLLGLFQISNVLEAENNRYMSLFKTRLTAAHLFPPPGSTLSASDALSLSSPQYFIQKLHDPSSPLEGKRH
jgi:hypothetical protein